MSSLPPTQWKAEGGGGSEESPTRTCVTVLASAFALGGLVVDLLQEKELPAGCTRCVLHTPSGLKVVRVPQWQLLRAAA